MDYPKVTQTYLNHHLDSFRWEVYEPQAGDIRGFWKNWIIRGWFDWEQEGSPLLVKYASHQDLLGLQLLAKSSFSSLL